MSDQETTARDIAEGFDTDDDARETEDDVHTSASLLPDNETERFTLRWQEIQASFVDEPRTSVEQADALVADLMQRLAARFSDERQRLSRPVLGQRQRSGRPARARRRRLSNPRSHAAKRSTSRRWRRPRSLTTSEVEPRLVTTIRTMHAPARMVSARFGCRPVIERRASMPRVR